MKETKPFIGTHHLATMLHGCPAEDAVDVTTTIDACARDDGRIDIDIPLTLSRRLSKLPGFEGLDGASEQPPAQG
ncbi:hypothetical protein B0J13DRAFT_236777 [Dactylonectria estremocensis]|uniref:Uncharacterized protein n=1 Tax=Dactylonectria estremocensis TaxID=1079267 RepID=A0A9P9IB72_9HYPO|nr:hypothetical protein B0J13DRAFT_291163 [Dactylonectria estremocensis]KAH7114978.1 hypothetical protein B0J13DRAFT_236777 [Dactylonectria estremocensis]